MTAIRHTAVIVSPDSEPEFHLLDLHSHFPVKYSPYPVTNTEASDYNFFVLGECQIRSHTAPPDIDNKNPRHKAPSADDREYRHLKTPRGRKDLTLEPRSHTSYQVRLPDHHPGTPPGNPGMARRAARLSNSPAVTNLPRHAGTA
ncbi:hypothetical protein C8035_v007138 [Colletotrichum spinosum]|uniref:Uncharacterized protein n=1 Tax=Colletotrichum spinosum TaxID=1347390 RepID=A0A4R8QAU0_9PEZI|nr:hypothetical protein C8035_v007138 [Colletotrichum spinosum]